MSADLLISKSSTINMLKHISSIILSSFSAGKNAHGDLRQCIGRVGFSSGDLRVHAARCDSWSSYFER